VNGNTSGFRRLWVGALPAGVLLGAVVAQGLGAWRTPPPSPSPRLAQRISAQPAGWTSQEIPLGANEFLANEAEKILNYDEFINREYARGAERFGLYVAYWGAGKMPVQLVASHTPDRCWTENGWHCLEMRFKQTDIFAGASLQPAEWRLFEPPLGGSPTYVLYWHLVDRHAYDFGARFTAIPDPVRWWKGAFQQVLHGRPEQYFIRITSSRPIEELWSDPGFREIMQALSELGLAQPAGGRGGV
jgi:Protein of unknown function (DUF3485)